MKAVLHRELIKFVNICGLYYYAAVITFVTLVTHVYTGGPLTVDLAIRVSGWSIAVNHNLMSSVSTCLGLAGVYKSLKRIEV